MRYFLITGLDEGYPIEPYIVETDADYPMLPPNEYGDRCRYYKPLTYKEVTELLKNGIEIF